MVCCGLRVARSSSRFVCCLMVLSLCVVYCGVWLDCCVKLVVCCLLFVVSRLLCVDCCVLFVVVIRWCPFIASCVWIGQCGLSCGGCRLFCSWFVV